MGGQMITCDRTGCDERVARATRRMTPDEYEQELGYPPPALYSRGSTKPRDFVWHRCAVGHWQAQP